MNTVLWHKPNDLSPGFIKADQAASAHARGDRDRERDHRYDDERSGATVDTDLVYQAKYAAWLRACVGANAVTEPERQESTAGSRPRQGLGAGSRRPYALMKRSRLPVMRRAEAFWYLR